MDKQTANQLNSNPTAKLAYLKSLLFTPNITAEQQSRIYHMIQKTEALIQRSSGISMLNQGTRSLIPDTRLATTKQDIQNADELRKQYDTETARKEAEFEADIKRRRAEFMNQQQQRRMEYEQALTNFESEFTNALTVFGLQTTYTAEQLKKAYKAMAVRVHPDRPSGNKEQFQYITKCYMLLVEKLKLRSNEQKSFMDLKRPYQRQHNSSNNSPVDGFDLRAKPSSSDPNDRLTNHFRDLYTRQQSKAPSIQLSTESQSFNNSAFNKLYEENRLWNPNDDGYGDWMDKGDRMTDEIEKPAKIFGDKFCLDVFNSTFENQRGTASTALTKYDRPQELVSCSSEFTTLDGATPITDFSKSADSTGSLTSASLTYTDYKKAYENGGINLMQTAGLKADRPSYRSVDELKKARADISFVMSDEDRRKEELRRQRETDAELLRQQRLRMHDQVYQDHYDNTHQRVLGFADSNTDGIARLPSSRTDGIARLPSSRTDGIARLPSSRTDGIARLPSSRTEQQGVLRY
jgi:curved DNA-binding protein CbpA